MERTLKPQLPCQTSYGSYPKWIIPAGTNVRISLKGTHSWRDYKTRIDLEFTDTDWSNATGIKFTHDSRWLIWVRRNDVRKS